MNRLVPLVLIVRVVRARRAFFQKPSEQPSSLATLGVVAAVIPLFPLASVLGFQTMPGHFYPIIALVILRIRRGGGGDQVAVLSQDRQCVIIGSYGVRKILPVSGSSTAVAHRRAERTLGDISAALSRELARLSREFRFTNPAIRLRQCYGGQVTLPTTVSAPYAHAQGSAHSHALLR
jgi:hypothetical protein